ncbi:MAG: vWA domain-containing protein [Kofleriaceae bacterium]
MITRQRIVTFGIPTAAAATITVAALLSPWTARNEPTPPDPIEAPARGNQIDLVFAVDTTGSMGGLIDSAKRTVWSIASHIRKTDETANIRIGLVAYRDVGDDYVTRDFPLSADLDAVFAELSSYQAAGGGDVPENVDAALDVTLHKMKWRSGAKKIVFVVGDAPPSSRGDVPTFEVLAREAASRKITINAIRAGHDSDTQIAFQQIAALGGGAYSSIQQDGGVQQVATPYDNKMAELSARIDSTMIIVGDEGVRRNHKAKMAAAEAAPAPAKADRAGYFATKGAGGRASEDLVGGVASGAMSFDGLVDESLPDDMRGMDKAQLKQEVEKRAAQRAQAQKELGELSKKRDEYLEANKPGAADAFDTQVKQAIEAQIK